MVTKGVRMNIRQLILNGRSISSTAVEKLLAHADEQDQEIERYRKALQEIVEIWGYDSDTPAKDMVQVAREALKGDSK